MKKIFTTMKIKLEEGAIAPMRSSEHAAGYDLYTWKDFIVQPGRNVIPTGTRIALPIGTEGHIRPRSGMSVKGMEGYPLVNGEGNFKVQPRRYDCDVIEGTLDVDYRGIVGIIVKNHTDAPFCVKGGTRLAQMVVEQCYMGEPEIIDSLDDTERGDGGFGHSGTR